MPVLIIETSQTASMGNIVTCLTCLMALLAVCGANFIVIGVAFTSH